MSGTLLEIPEPERHFGEGNTFQNRNVSSPAPVHCKNKCIKKCLLVTIVLSKTIEKNVCYFMFVFTMVWPSGDIDK